MRELRNAIERAALLGEGELITEKDLPLEIFGKHSSPLCGHSSSNSFQLPKGGVVLEEMEVAVDRRAPARAHRAPRGIREMNGK